MNILTIKLSSNQTTISINFLINSYESKLQFFY